MMLFLSPKIWKKKIYGALRKHLGDTKESILLFALDITQKGLGWSQKKRPHAPSRYCKLFDALSSIFHDLAKQKEYEGREQGHLHVGRVPMGIGVAPEYAASNVGGYFKGNSAISIAGNVMGRGKEFSADRGLSLVCRRHHVGFFE